MTKKNEGKSPTDLSKSEIRAAEKEGAKDAIRESAKLATERSRDTLAGEVKNNDKRFRGGNTTQLEPLLNLGAEELKARLDDKADDALTDEQAKALLALERAGPNRTDHVKALCKRIGVDSPYEVTHSGPPWTNDQTSVSKL